MNEENNLSGAAVLTERALAHLSTLMAKEYLSRDDFLLSLKKECISLSRSQKSMASLYNELFYVLKAAEKEENLEEAKDAAKTSIKERLDFLKKAETAIIEYAMTLFSESITVLTHSRSSTVEKILIHAYQKAPFYVVVTEGRPNFEGRLLAETLSAHGIPVTFVVDAAATLFSPDFVLVGADAVTPRHVINKIGTKFLALTFPTYVACSTSKFTTREVIIEEKNPEEVLKIENERKYKKIQVKNYYFDGTPLEYIKGFITEYGILTPEKVKSYLKIPKERK